MTAKPRGVAALATALLTAGIVGSLVFSAAFYTWFTRTGISPLAAIVSFAWSAALITAAVLIWRRSRRAPAAFLVAMACMVPVPFALFPGVYALAFPGAAVVLLCAFVGHRYLVSSAPAAG